MVRLRVAGGGLSEGLDDLLTQAARLYAQGDYGAAAALYHKIIEWSPRHPVALNFLGLIAQRANKPQLALTLFEDALATKPDFALARFNRGVVLRLLGRREEALQSARMAVECDAGLAEAWDMIGLILREKGEYAEAAACHTRAIEWQPGNASFYEHYAHLLFVQGRLGPAYTLSQKAEELDPSYPPMLAGNILQMMGYPERAAERFARAFALRPAFAEAAASEAMARLQSGDFEQGWALWEKRPDLEQSLRAISLWQGQKSESLLLYEDQGIGDALQFARYIPLLQNLADNIILRVRAPLQRLWAENFSDVTVLPEDTALPTVNARCRLSSLPFFFRTALSNIPSTPYIQASMERRVLWRPRLRSLQAPRIGLVWAGNRQFHNEEKRSIPFPAFQPLLACGAAHFVSLQKDRPEFSDSVAASGIFDAAPRLEDFADTAALVAELDLVITVDTAVAHLAGALGRPVFILLPFESDWRWLLGRQDSPWYKSARLFRQQKPGDWESVIADVAREIKKLIAGDRTVLNPPRWDGIVLRQNPNALRLP